MSRRQISILMVAAALVLASADAEAQTVLRVDVEMTQFRVFLSDGSVLPQSRLPAAVLSLGDGSGSTRSLRIDAVEPDTRDPTGEIMLYTFSERDAATGEWRNACQPDPDGRRLGFPIPGAFTADMRYVPAPGRLSITCTGGAEGKCIRFGYKPWGHAPDGASLAPYYQACLRLVRADYRGDGVGHTRNGMPIDIFDRIGIQTDEPARGMTLEAAWGPDGALCVAHVRLPQDPKLVSTSDSVQNLQGRLSPLCDETTPALLYDRSFERR